MFYMGILNECNVTRVSKNAKLEHTVHMYFLYAIVWSSLNVCLYWHLISGLSSSVLFPPVLSYAHIFLINQTNCHFFVMISTLSIEAIISAGLHCSCINHLANSLKFCTWQDIWLKLMLPAIWSFTDGGDVRFHPLVISNVQVPDLQL